MPREFSVRFSAYRELAELSAPVTEKVTTTFFALARNPLHELSVPVVKNNPKYRSIAVGYYDILYQLWEEGIEILGVLYRPWQSEYLH